MAGANKRKLNKRKFGEIILRVTRKAARQVLIGRANRIFEEVKKDIINQVKNHPVCIELKDHTSPSQFLNGRSGTLFGFLGFHSGDDPVDDLILLLEDTIRPRVQRKLIKVVRIDIWLPSVKQLRENLALPWEGGLSWPEAIEQGISGLGSYLPVPRGRSGEGIQKEKKFRSVEFTPVPFLTEIFENARKKIPEI